VTPPAPEGQSNSIGRIAVHPLDGRHVFVEGLGVSRDAGATWTGDRRQGTSERLFAPKGQPGVLFRQIAGSRVQLPRSDESVYGGVTSRSTDFGESWSQVHGPITAADDSAISPFASDPGRPDHIYATLRTPFKCGGTCTFAFLPGDISIVDSIDGGLTWRAASAGLPGPNIPFLQFGFQAGEGPAPAAPSRLFFTLSQQGAFVSEDNARTWKPLGTESTGLAWVRQDPHRANVLYALGNRITAFRADILRSDDAGATWRTLRRVDNTNFSQSSIMPMLTLDPVRPGRLWLTGLEAGVFLSEDGGESWANIGFAGQTVDHPGVEWGTVVTELVPAPGDSPEVYLVWRNRLYRGGVGLRDRVAVEYQHDDRFWITADPAEAGFMDYRQSDALRSGEGFGLWSALTAPAGAIGICRFQGNPASGQHSRFITLQGGECEAVKRDTRWVLEGQNEWFAMPPTADGSCAAGLVPVTRFFNGKADANHRYVADAGAAAQMRARGWIEEGIALCARALVGG
jgi:hypothetical protein